LDVTGAFFAIPIKRRYHIVSVLTTVLKGLLKIADDFLSLWINGLEAHQSSFASLIDLSCQAERA